MRPVAITQRQIHFHLSVLAFLVVATACKLVFWNGVSTTQDNSQTKKPFFPITKPTTKFHSHVKFVFFMGLEGTGHHLIADLARYSPLVERLRSRNIHPELTVPLVRSLFDDDTHQGLMDAHCKPLVDTTISPFNMETRKNWNSQPWKKKHPPHQRHLQAAERNSDNSKSHDNLMQRTAQALQAIESAVTSRTIFPINVWYNTDQDKEFAASGMMSYPNMKGKCRSLNYPSLDLLYQACDRANVDCGHVLLHRPAKDVLESTWNRGFHDKGPTTLLSAIHLYNTHLQIQMAQLVRHAGRTMGCVSLLSQEEDSFLKDISKWFEYSDSQWKDFYKNHYREPHHSGTTLDLESPKLRSYLELMETLMDDALNLC